MRHPRRINHRLLTLTDWRRRQSKVDSGWGHFEDHLSSVFHFKPYVETIAPQRVETSNSTGSYWRIGASQITFNCLNALVGAFHSTANEHRGWKWELKLCTCKSNKCLPAVATIFTSAWINNDHETLITDLYWSADIITTLLSIADNGEWTTLNRLERKYDTIAGFFWLSSDKSTGVLSLKIENFQKI